MIESRVFKVVGDFPDINLIGQSIYFPDGKVAGVIVKQRIEDGWLIVSIKPELNIDMINISFTIDTDD